jgi:hypothetical protein
MYSVPSDRWVGLLADTQRIIVIIECALVQRKRVCLQCERRRRRIRRRRTDERPAVENGEQVFLVCHSKRHGRKH